MTWPVGAKMHLKENEFLEIINNLKTISDEKTIKLWYLHGLDAGLYMRCNMRKDPEDF